MPFSEEKLSWLTDLAYEAVLDPTRWQVFLAELAAQTEASAAHFVLHSSGGRASTYSYGFQPETLRRYGSVLIDDPWVSLARVETGLANVSHRITSDEFLLQTRFYEEILRPADLFYGSALIVSATADLISAVAVLRSRAAGPFDDRIIEYYYRLFPHLNRVARLHNAFAECVGERNAALASLDHVGHGMVLLDGSLEVMHVNAQARTLLEKGECLFMRDGRLRARYVQDDQRLSRAIEHACAATEHGFAFPATSVLVRRREGRQPLVVMVSAMGWAKGSPLMFPTAHVTLLLRDLEVRAEPDPGILREMFQFTPAECAVASELCRGSDVGQLAAHLSISVQTARTHIKRMLSKTGTRRQAQLVALVARLLRAME